MAQLPSSQRQVRIKYQTIRLPPVRDILVLGKRYPHGKTGVMECFRFIAPDEFEMFDVPDPDEAAEAVMIHKRILKRIPVDGVMALLRRHVFPFITCGEAINVDFEVVTTVDGITIDEP